MEHITEVKDLQSRFRKHDRDFRTIFLLEKKHSIYFLKKYLNNDFRETPRFFPYVTKTLRKLFLSEKEIWRTIERKMTHNRSHSHSVL